MSGQSLKDRCAIVGVGESPYAHRAERPYKELQIEAIAKAIADAGLEPADIDGIITDAADTAPIMPIEEVMAALKIPNVTYISYAYRGGPGVMLSTQAAAQAICQGTAKNVLFYFGVDWGSHTGAAYNAHHDFKVKMPFELPYAFFGQPVYFAATVRRYQQEYGYSEEDMIKGLGALAVACRKHAQLHPGAQTYGRPLTLDDYRKSRVVSTPMRVADCCLLTDGGGAYVMTSAERAKDCPHPPVYLTGVAQGALPVTTDSVLTQSPDYLAVEAATISSKRALEMAGVGLKDIDFAELYDCFTIALLLEIESLGFCKKGEGLQWVQDGRVELGGEVPINTHGGLLAHAYVHCINHLVEAVHQLRHEAGARQVKNAEIGMLHAGPGNVVGTLILRR